MGEKTYGLGQRDDRGTVNNWRKKKSHTLRERERQRDRERS